MYPAYWACLFDEAIPIIYQPKAYWDRNLKMANEANPIGSFLMKSHISGIFLIAFIWLVVIGLISYFIPLKYLKTFVLFVLLAQTWGASSWFSQYYGFWSAITFIAFNSILFIKIERIHLNTYKTGSLDEVV